MSRTPFEDRLVEIFREDAPAPPLNRWRAQRFTPVRWRNRFAGLGTAAAMVGVVAVAVLAFVATAKPHVPAVATHTVGPTAVSSVIAPTGSVVNPSGTPPPSATTSSRGGPAPSRAATPRATAQPSTVWTPAAGAEWQIENDHPLDTSNAVDMGTSNGSGPVTTYSGSIAPAPKVYEVDGFDNPASTIAALHSKGLHVICSVDVGTWENWRSDASSFPSSVLGNNNGSSNERWLDIRQLSILEPLMTSRLQMCKSKGFDAVDADNVDGYINNTGFALSSQDQLTYNTWVSQEAHSLGLGVALHNDTGQAAQLVANFDFAVDEQCFQYSECQSLVSSFGGQGKAVFEVEYSVSTSSFCPQSNAWNFSGLSEPQSLNGNRSPCR